MVYLIWAQDENNLIGKKDSLPWVIPEDTQHFHKTINEKIILIGYRTWKGMKDKNIKLNCQKIYVLAKEDVSLDKKDVQTKKINLKEAKKILEDYQKNKNKDLWVCGGAFVYQLAWKFAQKLYITEIKEKFFGDVYFPISNWKTKTKILEKIIDKKEFKITIYQKND